MATNIRKEKANTAGERKRSPSRNDGKRSERERRGDSRSRKEEAVARVEVQNAARNQRLQKSAETGSTSDDSSGSRDRGRKGVPAEKGTEGKAMVEEAVGHPQTILTMDASPMIKEEKEVAVTGQEGDIGATVTRRKIGTVNDALQGFSQ